MVDTVTLQILVKMINNLDNKLDIPAKQPFLFDFLSILLATLMFLRLKFYLPYICHCNFKLTLDMLVTPESLFSSVEAELIVLVSRLLDSFFVLLNLIGATLLLQHVLDKILFLVLVFGDFQPLEMLLGGVDFLGPIVGSDLHFGFTLQPNLANLLVQLNFLAVQRSEQVQLSFLEGSWRQSLDPLELVQRMQSILELAFLLMLFVESECVLLSSLLVLLRTFLHLLMVSTVHSIHRVELLLPPRLRQLRGKLLTVDVVKLPHALVEPVGDDLFSPHTGSVHLTVVVPQA